MLYLSLPPSDGALANDCKEHLLGEMHSKRIGLYHAADSLGISKARVFAELKADKVFAQAVESAREMLAEYLAEEAVAIADKATGRDDTPAQALKYKARMDAAQILARFKIPGPGSHYHLHRDTVYVSEEKREALQAQRERIMADPTRAAVGPTSSRNELPGPVVAEASPDNVASPTEKTRDQSKNDSK